MPKITWILIFLVDGSMDDEKLARFFAFNLCKIIFCCLVGLWIEKLGI
jgi:hypothetical protein